MNPLVQAGADLMWHNIRRAFGVVCVILFFGMILYMGYITFWKPHHNPIRTQEQNAENMQINYLTETDDSFFFGIKVFGLKLGISKPTQVKKPPMIKPIKGIEE